MVEVLSKSSHRRDRELKASLYAQRGVPEYWLVDPHRKTVEVFANPGTTGYERRAVCADVVRSTVAPGLEIPLARIFAGPPRR